MKKIIVQKDISEGISTDTSLDSYCTKILDPNDKDIKSQDLVFFKHEKAFLEKEKKIENLVEKNEIEIENIEKEKIFIDYSNDSIPDYQNDANLDLKIRKRKKLKIKKKEKRQEQKKEDLDLERNK